MGPVDARTEGDAVALRSRTISGRVLRVSRVWGHPGAPAWTYVGVIRHRKVKEAAGIPAELQGGRTEGATIKIHGEMVLLWGRLVTQAP
jgi:hypothetical protein